MKLSPRFSVKMTISDILYLSYLVPTSRLRPLVPDILPLATMDGDKVFISVVTFHCTGVKIVSLPFLRFAYYQVNLRTYVTDPLTGDHGVYFFRSGITSTTTALLTRLLSQPWEHITFDIRAKQDEQKHYIQYIPSGYWHGELHIEVREEAAQIKDMPPFANAEEAIKYLTGPLIGFYGPSGKVYRFRVWHSPIEPRLGRLLKIHFPFVKELELLKEQEIEQPHNLLLAPHGQFRVFLPLRRV